MFFRRYLTKTPFSIPFKDVLNVRIGRWHSGRWAGGAPAVKIFWNKEGNLLCSGFVLSRDISETNSLAQEIRSLAANQTGKCAQEADIAETFPDSAERPN